MLLGNYQPIVFGLTLKYAHEDIERLFEYRSDRISLALLFSITDQFGFSVKYSHTEFDIANVGDRDRRVYLKVCSISDWTVRN